MLKTVISLRWNSGNKFSVVLNVSYVLPVMSYPVMTSHPVLATGDFSEQEVALWSGSCFELLCHVTAPWAIHEARFSPTSDGLLACTGDSGILFCSIHTHGVQTELQVHPHTHAQTHVLPHTNTHTLTFTYTQMHRYTCTITNTCKHTLFNIFCLTHIVWSRLSG